MKGRVREHSVVTEAEPERPHDDISRNPRDTEIQIDNQKRDLKMKHCRLRMGGRGQELGDTGGLEELVPPFGNPGNQLCCHLTLTL